MAEALASPGANGFKPDDAHKPLEAPKPGEKRRNMPFYLENGDIVLSALDAEGADTVFRVHRLFLMNRSSVFREIFSTLAEKRPLSYDGVPLVELPPADSDKDVAQLLEVLYDVSVLHNKLCSDHRADTPLALASLYEIASRYKIKGIVDSIKDHVRKDWPTTLAGWEVRQFELQASPTTHDLYPEPVSAIQFATHAGTPSVLPAAFYQLAITPTSRDWRDDRLHDAGATTINAAAARWHMLDAANAVRFLKGRDALIRFYFERVKERLDRPADTARCRCDLAALRLEIESQAVNRELDCLWELQQFATRPDRLQGLCDGCQGRIRTGFRDLRVEIWRNLPDFFSGNPGGR